MNPTDGAGITSSLYVGQLSEQAAGQTAQSKKARRRELKAKRAKFGDACQADFQGPWANYEGMEEFKGQKGGILTEQQKTIMEAYEEKRKERLTEAKIKDPS